MIEQTRISQYNREALRKYVYPRLSGVNIVNGCGTRPCYICSEGSPVYQGSMDYDVVDEIFEGYSISGRNKRLMVFGRGDTIYYHSGEHRVKAVVELARKYGIAINIRTHGCLQSDTETTEAVREMVQYIREAGLTRNQVRFDMSVDDYGWINVDRNEQLASIASFYRLIAPLNPTVYVFYNENADDYQLGGRKHVHEFTAAAGIPIDCVCDQTIHSFGPNGRSSKIEPTPPPIYYGYRPWDGTFIEATGDLSFLDPSMGVIKIGNIFDTIHTQSIQRLDNWLNPNQSR